MKLNYKKLGDYIQLVDERNNNLEISNLLGINIQKKFMPSVANTSETDLSKYKVIDYYSGLNLIDFIDVGVL